MDSVRPLKNLGRAFRSGTQRITNRTRKLRTTLTQYALSKFLFRSSLGMSSLTLRPMILAMTFTEDEWRKPSSSSSLLSFSGAFPPSRAPSWAAVFSGDDSWVAARCANAELPKPKIRTKTRIESFGARRECMVLPPSHGCNRLKDGIDDLIGQAIGLLL